VEFEQILALIVFSLMHWVLALMLLEDLAYRKRVLGGRKWPWAIAIIFITFIGSLVYLLFHPKILQDHDGDDK
jgi:hypothetical protein